MYIPVYIYIHTHIHRPHMTNVHLKCVMSEFRFLGPPHRCQAMS